MDAESVCLDLSNVSQTVGALRLDNTLPESLRTKKKDSRESSSPVSGTTTPENGYKLEGDSGSQLGGEIRQPKRKHADEEEGEEAISSTNKRREVDDKQTDISRLQNEVIRSLQNANLKQNEIIQRLQNANLELQKENAKCMRKLSLFQALFRNKKRLLSIVERLVGRKVLVCVQ